MANQQFEKIKNDISEILEVVNLCPEKLQEKCFEILLQAAIQGKDSKKLPTASPINIDDTAQQDELTATKISSGAEIEGKDIHTKAKRIVPSELSLEEINNLFYKEGDEFMPLYDDLKSPKISEAQIRVALMEALKNGLKSGDFTFDVKTVRTLCETHKCYDTGNFSANFKNNKGYFNEEYTSAGRMSLTTAGKKQMVVVSKDLAK